MYKIWILIIFISLPFSAQSNPPMELVTLEYPPYIEVVEGETTGVAVELVKEVFRQLDVPIEIRVMPWARALALVERGRADGVFTIFKNAQREAYADFSEQILFNQNISVITYKGSGITTETVTKGDVSSLTLCVVNGVSYGKIVDGRVNDGKFKLIFQRNSAEECAQLLRARRADVWINNEFGAISLLVRMGLEQEIEIVTPPVESTPSFIAFSKTRRHKTMRQEFDRVLRQMKSDGRYQALVDYYFDQMRPR